MKPATVYTYVSRGRLDPVRLPGDQSSWFRAADVQRLTSARTDRRRDRRRTAVSAETEISFIDGTSYWYRGRPALELARSHTFEQVAEFLWTGVLPPECRWQSTERAEVPPIEVPDPGYLPLHRLRIAVARLAAADHLRFGRAREALVVTARHLIVDMVEALPVLGEPADGSLAGRLWSRLTAAPGRADQIAALDSILTIIADHGIAPSTIAARMAAAYRADLYGAVETGLAVVAGAWHGGRSLSAEEMLAEIERVGDTEQVLGELFRRGRVPCLGQPRYRSADPRVEVILDAIDTTADHCPFAAAVREIRRMTDERALPSPSVELALAAASHSFGFVKGASEAIFAVGRSAGWIAHAMEEYARPVPSPPGSTYTGPEPAQG